MSEHAHAHDAPAPAPVTTDHDIDGETDTSAWDEAADWLRQAVIVTRSHYNLHDTPPTRSTIARTIGPPQSAGNTRLRQSGVSIRGLWELAGIPWRTDIIATLVHDHLDSIGTDRAVVTAGRLHTECERYDRREIGKGLRSLCENKDGCAVREAAGGLVGERGETNHARGGVDRSGRETPVPGTNGGGGR
jgi:hypothetical protein